MIINIHLSPVYNITTFFIAGEAKETNSQQAYKLPANEHIVVPEYFWKAVCDPTRRESIVFVAENNVGEKSFGTKKIGCFGQEMTTDRGVVLCYSLDEARAKYPHANGFKFPDFNAVNCGTAVLGNFAQGDIKEFE